MAFNQWESGNHPVTFPRLYSNNLRVLLQAVAGGNGVALLPFPACKEELQNGGLVQLFPEWSGQPRQIYALFPANKGMPAVARYFMDELTMRQEKLNSGHQKVNSQRQETVAVLM